jgi:hypothetical protein
MPYETVALRMWGKFVIMFCLKKRTHSELLEIGQDDRDADEKHSIYGVEHVGTLGSGGILLFDGA